MSNQEQLADIALIGLAVMGENLVLNLDDHGFKVCVFNRTVQKVDEFLSGKAEGTNVIGSHSLEEMVSKLKSPRKVMMLVKAGQPVQDFIDLLVPLLTAGDIVIDGGNSEFSDTLKREQELRKKGLFYIGCGVSGGEEGARRGPSLMPGGSAEAWPQIKTMFQSISAKVNGDPCCEWVGSGGSGHFVKMVHNGIEYGDMQLICEAYHLMKDVLLMDNEQMAETFDEWNSSELESFLVEITRDILRFKEKNGDYLIDQILDRAAQKGTGKWTVMCSLDHGIPLTLISEAVYARYLSGLKDERVMVSKHLNGPTKLPARPDTKEFIGHIKKALYASKIISYTQGFMLMREVGSQHKWNLNMGGIALMWRGGCIIRSKFLGNIKTAYDKKPDLVNLLLDDFFKNVIHDCQTSWRHVIATAVGFGIPLPAFSSALSFYDGYRSQWLPANLLQAMRDYFGAHTYTMIDEPGIARHTDWTAPQKNLSRN